MSDDFLLDFERCLHYGALCSIAFEWEYIPQLDSSKFDQDPIPFERMG